jgi:uncharacterized protein YecE (DUF72 family)
MTSGYASVARKWWLEYYSERFNATEVDNTFYHLLRENVTKSWYERTPADFHFAVKGHRYITLIRRLKPLAAWHESTCARTMDDAEGCAPRNWQKSLTSRLPPPQNLNSSPSAASGTKSEIRHQAGDADAHEPFLSLG